MAFTIFILIDSHFRNLRALSLLRRLMTQLNDSIFFTPDDRFDAAGHHYQGLHWGKYITINHTYTSYMLCLQLRYYTIKGLYINLIKMIIKLSINTL